MDIWRLDDGVSDMEIWRYGVLECWRLDAGVPNVEVWRSGGSMQDVAT